MRALLERVRDFFDYLSLADILFAAFVGLCEGALAYVVLRAIFL